jgi:CHAD domain-containing protein
MTPPAPRGERSTALLQSRIRELFRHVPRALVGDVEAVHQMRVAGRRLRVGLPLLASRPDGKRVRRAIALLRQLTRVAGESRDLDVMMEVLEPALAPPGRRPKEQTLLLRRLKDARRRRQARMAEDLLDLDIAQLRRDLRAIVGRGGDRMLAVLVRLREVGGTLGDDLRAGFVELGARFDPEALHELRILARRLRYVSELEGELTHRPSPAPEILKGLQDELGCIRDLYLVTPFLAAQAARETAAPVAAEARRLEGLFLARSRAQHGQAVSREPVERLLQAIQAMGAGSPAA